MAVHLRRATPADAAAVAEIYLRARTELVACAPLVYRDDDVRAWIRTTLLPAGRTTVAIVDGPVAGFVSTSQTADGGWIEQLYVRPDLVGAGIGSRLLAVALRELTLPIGLHTFAANAHGCIGRPGRPAESPRTLDRAAAGCDDEHIMRSMNALRLRARGPAVLAYEEAPRPEPDAGEVLVRVHAAAVTPTELEWEPTSTTPDGAPRPLPLVLGHEFSGEIAAVGAGVSGLATGDVVYGMNDWYRDGAQAEYCVARADEVAPKPRSLDHVHAAAVPISALTAWQGLVDHGRLAAGQRVLIHGGSGGVGLFAVQVARRLDAHVVATVSAGNLDFVRDLGAHEAIDYRARRFDDVVRDMDLVFDTVGGETLARSWNVLRAGGRVVTIAASSEYTAEPREKDAFFIVEAKRDELVEIARRIDAGELRVFVGAVFPLAQGRDAYAHKPDRGKVVVRTID